MYEPHIQGMHAIAGRLRAYGQIEMDTGATRDPNGIFEDKEGKNKNLTQVSTGLLQGLLSLEKGIHWNKSNDKECERIGELVSFASRIFFLDPDRFDPSEIHRYHTLHSVKLYLPQIQQKHETEIHPPESYNFEIPAIISTSIYDHKTDRRIVMGTMPIGYSFYKGHQELAGTTTEEATSTLAYALQSHSDGVEKIRGIIDDSKETIQYPHFFIRLEEGKHNKALYELRGEVITRNGSNGIDLYSPSSPDIRVFIPLNLHQTQDETMHNGNSTIVTLSKTLLRMRIKSQKTLQKLYPKTEQPE